MPERRLLKRWIVILLFGGLVPIVLQNSAWSQPKFFQNTRFYTPVSVDPAALVQSKQPKNIILFIGDGMGLAQISAGLTANKGRLNLEYFKHVGFSRTQSANRYVTDSAAGGTAISTGVKTYNGAIGVNGDTVAVPTILELAEARGLATGLVVTCPITHATPAAFIAHQKSRALAEAIAADFLKIDIDVFVGGGRTFFENRKDGRNLIHELENKGYTVLDSLGSEDSVKSGPLAVFTSEKENPPADRRGDLLPKATALALRLLSQNKQGFFLMVEGSLIDWGGHANDIQMIVQEMLDFDQAIGEGLKFAAEDGNTLIIVTADHETGGLALEGGSYKEGCVMANFTTKDHTGVMVPVFAMGPQKELFMGMFENTAVFEKMKEALGL